MKNNPFRSFAFASISLGILLIGGATVLEKFFLPDKDYSSVWFIVPFIMAFTLLFHYLLLKASVETPRTFVGKFMAFTGVKLIVYMSSILVYAFVIKKEVVIFLLTFFLAYLFFTVLEISHLLKFLKKTAVENTKTE